MKSSAAPAEQAENLQIRTTRAGNPYCRYLKKYLPSKRHMERIDDSICVSLHLNPEDVLPIPECVEFP